MTPDSTAGRVIGSERGGDGWGYNAARDTYYLKDIVRC